MTDMRFMHLADLHIGKKVNEFSMLEDQKYILGQVLDLAHDKKVDGVLMTRRCLPLRQLLCLIHF